MFTSSGIIRYFDIPLKVIVEVDPEIVNYYRALVPKWITINKQLHLPHISVIRNEVPTIWNKWKQRDGEKIDFQYSHDIKHGKVYYWLEAYSSDLEDLRVELGMSANSDITRPPDHHDCFHITIGNMKEINLGVR